MKRLLLAVASIILLCPEIGHGQGYWPGSPGVAAKHSQHATDCTALTSGVKGEICEELDGNTFFVCEVASCTVPGDWTAYTGAGSSEFSTLTDVGNLCAAGQAVVRNPGDTGFTCAAAGTGDITDVGDCATGACFEGVGAETTLRSATSILLDLDNDNNGAESFSIRDGLDAVVFQVTEGSAVAITGAGSNFNISGTAPYIGISDTDLAGNQASSGEVRLENAQTICWRSAPDASDVCLAVDSFEMFTPTGAVAIRIPQAAAPALGGSAQMAYDTDILGTKGAVVVHNGTAPTYLVGTTDVPTDGQVPTFVDASDTVEWQTPAGTEVNNLETITTGILDDEVPVGSGAGVATYLALPITGTNGCAGATDALQYNTATNTWGCAQLSGTGTVASVGNCNGPDCFTGAEGTSLFSNTDLIFDLDDDNNGTESFQIRDGLDVVGFEVLESGLAESAVGFQGPAADPADTGVFRLGNTESICWERDPAGADVCLSNDASENLLYTGPQLGAEILMATRNANPPSVGFDVYGGATTAFIDLDPLGRGTGRTLGFRVNSTTTLLTMAEDTSSFTFGSNTVVNAGDSASFEVPNAAAPTTDATGEIALDTTITDHQPLLQYFDGGENMSVIAIDTAQLPALDNEIIKYDAATDKFVLEADATGGDACVHLSAQDITCASPDGCSGTTITTTGFAYTAAEFSSTADQSGSWTFDVPTGFTGTTASIRVDWLADDASCNGGVAPDDDVCWAVDSGSVTESSAFGPPTLGGTVKGVQDTCHTQADLLQVTMTGYVHGMTDGQRGVLTIFRDVDGGTSGCTGDDLNVNARLVGITVCPE